MRLNEIQPGRQYAVQQVIRAAAGMPTMRPVRECTVIERQPNNRVLVSYSAHVRVRPAEDSNSPDQLLPYGGVTHRDGRDFAPGTKFMTVSAKDVLCPWEDYHGKPQPDGRIDAPEVTHAAGSTFTKQRLG